MVSVRCDQSGRKVRDQDHQINAEVSLADWIDRDGIESLGIDHNKLPPPTHTGHDGRDVWARDAILEIVRGGAL